ncbi:MAG TPA: hypothetical protein VFA77_03870 [Candidatus Eisenbacteria bacterium]|nr:hypothetical protein [Candidatus Eisenbacteria bacterium]
MGSERGLEGGCRRVQDKAVTSPTHHRSPRRWRVCVGASNWRKLLRCVSFVLLTLLSLAPLAQAQTNRPSGTVVSWGWQVLPYVEPGARFTAIAAGAFHTLALKTNGTVVAWGKNYSGQATAPVAAQSGVVAIAAGDSHTVALETNGSVVAWGRNDYGHRPLPLRRESFSL